MANIFGIENGRVESPYADWVKTEAGDQYQLVRLWTPEHPIGPQKAAAIGRVVVHTINEMQRAEEQEHMALSGALTFHGRVSTYQEMPPDILARYTNQAPWDGGS